MAGPERRRVSLNVEGGKEGRMDVRLAADQVSPISFSVAFTPNDIGRADRMITMEMR